MSAATTTPPGTAIPSPRGRTRGQIDPNRRRRGIIGHSLTLAWRSLLKIRYTPEQFVDVTLQPIIFVAMFVYLFGGAIGSGDRHAYLQYVLPGVIVQTVVFSTMSIGVTLATDLSTGIFDRFRSLPIARPSPLIGALFADIVRFITPVLVSLAFGAAIGFRLHAAWWQPIVATLLLVVFSMALSWLPILVGLLARSPGAVQGLGFLFFFPLTFGSNAYVQTSTLPGWLQAWVNVNPVTFVTEAVRGLMIGGPIGSPLWKSIAWSVGLFVVLAPIATRIYRRKA